MADEVTSEAPVPSHAAHKLLARAQSPELAATIFKDKVQHRPLILKPTSPDPLSKDARAARRRERLHKKAYQLRKQKPKRLSAKEQRKLGIHEIPADPAMRKWELYAPLRRMWWGYMQGIIGIEPAKESTNGASTSGTNFVTGMVVGPKLASADYHGAELEVVRSNCVSRVGLKGIVLKDTKFTFDIVTRADEIKTIPKKHTVFRFEVPRIDLGPMPTKPGEHPQLPARADSDGLPPFVFELHGSQFEIRPVDRANKKFKPRRMDDL